MRSAGSGIARATSERISSLCQSHAAIAASNSAQGIDTCSGWPWNSSWYAAQPISFARIGHTWRPNSSGRCCATSAAIASAVAKRGRRRHRTDQLVVQLRAVRDATARADVEHRLATARGVRVRAVLADVEAPAPSLRQQHHLVDEVEAEPADDHVRTGSEAVEVGIGGVLGREVHQLVAGGVVDQLRMLAGRLGVEVAEAQDDRIGVDRRSSVVERDAQPVAVEIVDRGRSRTVHHHRGAVSDRFDRPLQAPAHVLTAEASRREVHRCEVLRLRSETGVGDVAGADRGGPLRERRPLPDRPGARDARIGEQGRVHRQRVHPQQRRLIEPPQATGSGRVRIDEVQLDRTRCRGGEVGGDPLDDADAARADAHDDDHAHPRSLPTSSGCVNRSAPPATSGELRRHPVREDLGQPLADLHGELRRHASRGSW